MSDIATERAKQIVVDTLREAASWDGDSALADLMRTQAQALDEMTTAQLTESACCPFCDEVICDNGCPLECVPRNQH